MNNKYDVLSPWADADAVPLRGILPRVTDLANKRIGLFTNAKRAASPIAATIEKKLKERYPTASFSYFPFGEIGSLEDINDVASLGRDPKEAAEERAKFEKWVKEVDTVVAAVGD